MRNYIRSIAKSKLQYKLTLAIFAVMLIIGIPGAALMIHYQSQSVTSQFEESAHNMAELIMISLKRDMVDADRAHIQETVLKMAEKQSINEVIIISNAMTIYASGEVDEINEKKDDEELQKVLSSGSISSRTEKQYGHDELCVILPILNEPDCYPCHGDSHDILGAVEVGLDRGPLKNQIFDQTLIMTLIAATTFLIVGVALTFTLRSTISKPLQKLINSTQRIARGDFSSRAEVTTTDEVGKVGHAFNDMAEQVQLYAQVLNESKEELERRVDERTTELQQMVTDRGQLLDKLVSAQEEERRRIARELHDEAGQALTMIMLDLSRALESLPEQAVDAKKTLANSRTLAAQTLEELRKLIYDLRPEVLDQLGLVPAIRSYTRSRLEVENIKSQLNFTGFDSRLAPQLENTLFRIIQEAITNIIRHSGATEVSIDIRKNEDSIVAAIKDNGKGFDVETALVNNGAWGLRGIRERISFFRGNLNIESSPGKGTSIQFRIPL